MMLTIIDQNEDVIGIEIRENCIDPNCCWIILEENYPVYIHCLSFDKASSHLIPLHIRTKCQKKDESAWSEYLKIDYRNLLKNWIQKNKDKPISPGDFWEQTLPPVWISRPDPNKLDVWVWVYNKAGDKSEPIKLIDLVNWKYKVEPLTKVHAVEGNNK